MFFDEFVEWYPIKLDLVYAQPEHPENMFKCPIYRRDAKMLGHKSLVPIVLRAAEICHQRSKYIFEVKDCLRPVEAQALMCESPIVRANPHWLQEPRRLSPPGAGGHPRGMAVDIILVTDNGDKIDMGTPFDYLSTDPHDNPAARNYAKLSDEVKKNRQILEDAMLEAAKEFDRKILPLPEEWWDFRFLPEYSAKFAPVSDKDLPPGMRMTSAA